SAMSLRTGWPGRMRTRPAETRRARARGAPEPHPARPAGRAPRRGSPRRAPHSRDPCYRRTQRAAYRIDQPVGTGPGEIDLLVRSGWACGSSSANHYLDAKRVVAAFKLASCAMSRVWARWPLSLTVAAFASEGRWGSRSRYAHSRSSRGIGDAESFVTMYAQAVGLSRKTSLPTRGRGASRSVRR